MRIGIDARYLSHGIVGGVQTYVRLLITGLVTYQPQNQYVLYCDAKRPFELANLPAGVTVRTLPYWGPPSSLINDFSLRRTAARDGLDLLHFPANYGFAPRGAKKVVTLHDQINVLPLAEIIRGHRKDPRTLLMMTYLHFCSLLSLRSADLVVTVSEYSRQKILATCAWLPPERIIAITNGPAPSLTRVEDPTRLAEVRQRHGLVKPFLLADALKNPAVLVRAWKLLPPEIRADWQMVFFSRRPDPLPVVQDAVRDGLARLLVNPSSADLAALYSLAQVFVFPSWIEGLGLPPLEAMTCGCPVIASDRGSIPEVTGGAAWIIDAEDERGLAGYLERLYHSPSDARDLRERGYRRAAEFGWEAVTARLAAAYEKLVNGTAPTPPQAPAKPV